ncbi:tripartite motif-containing protein 75-like [Suncus etruscus]|uniref:tripartite motif-containing protein 75-like n=1 Tax=Suncus etruscus TaxID=109475 RepID=UPI00211048F2|nr:tripartite motif-containing protein 75-like [Suncus etruscus]
MTLPLLLAPGAALALGASLAELRIEAHCPLCRDFLQKPVTLDCGHNCCASCLQQRWEHLQDDLPCPVCLQPWMDRQPQRNTQLGYMIDLVQQLTNKNLKVAELVEEEEEEEGDEEKGRGHCERHRQVLSLFCEDDLELLCGQCTASIEHQAHVLSPMSEAAAHHRQRLKSCLGRLGKQLEEAETIFENRVWEGQGWREKVENWRRHLVHESEHLKCFLKIEENVLQNRLSRQMTGFSKKIIDRQIQLSDIGSTLKSLLRDILGLWLRTDLALLRGAEHMHRQWQLWGGLELPSTFSYQYVEPALLLLPYYAGLHNLKHHFQVRLTLDPDTAHPSLRVFQDRKTVSFHPLGRAGGPTSAPRSAFTSLEAILGMQGFALSRVGVFLDYDLEEIAFYNLVNCSHFCTLKGSFMGKLLPYFCVSNSPWSGAVYRLEDELQLPLQALRKVGKNLEKQS